MSYKSYNTFFQTRLQIVIILFLFSFPLYLFSGTNLLKPNQPAKSGIDQKTMDFWENTMKYGTITQKDDIINSIKTGKKAQGTNLILKFIQKEKNPKVKKSMISALVVLSNKKAVSYLLEMIKDKAVEEKIFAITQLGELKYKDSFKTIIDYIDSEDDLLAEATLRTLGDTQAEPVIDRLIKKLENEKKERIRTQIILALANIKSVQSQDKLVSIFTNKEEKEINRMYAISGLGWVKNKRSYDILTKFFPDETAVNLKRRLIDALGELGDPGASDLIMESLGDDDRDVRISCIKALGKLKAVKAIEVLKYKKDFDPDLKVRGEAKVFIEKFEPEKKKP